MTTAIFLVLVAGIIGLTRWAAKLTVSARDFYTAGASIGGFQNGLAMAGNYISAAAFLGIPALLCSRGMDGFFYSVGFTMSWLPVLFLLAERLRNLGTYSFADVVGYRLDRVPVRILSASGSLVVVILMMVAQMVGGGQLFHILFGISYASGLLLVAALMVGYVLFGGMLAVTWVQTINVCLVLAGFAVMTVLGLTQFDFDFGAVLERAMDSSVRHAAMLTLSPQLGQSWFSALSLEAALICGTAGLPHILMRFFTVPDARQARRSVFYTVLIIGCFLTMVLLSGFMAVSLVWGDPSLQHGGELVGGNNLTTIYLARAVGGDALNGFIAAAAFTTILAVVSGLAMAGAAALSQDIYVRILRRGCASEREQVLAGRVAVVLMGGIAVVLSLPVENQNAAFLASVALGVAASVNFPVLVMSLFWRGLTTRGAVIGGFIGLITAVTCVVLGPAVWVQVLHFDRPIFPSEQYALLSMAAAFAGIWLFSVTDTSKRGRIDRAGFLPQRVRSETGLGAAGAGAD